MIGYDELMLIRNKVVEMGDPFVALQSWGIDPEEFRRFLLEGAVEGDFAYTDRPEVNESKKLATAMSVGFFLGFLTAGEIT